MANSIVMNNMMGNCGAKVIVEANSGATVTCSNGSVSYKTTSPFTEFVFLLDYGTWTITSQWDNGTRSKSIDITALRVYRVNLVGTTYGISIDMDNSSPNLAVSYIADAEGMEPLHCHRSDSGNSEEDALYAEGECVYGSWKDVITDWLGVKPCVVTIDKTSGTKSIAYLNPDDYSKFEDGSSAASSISNETNSGTIIKNVMVEFKKRWYRYSKNGNILTFEVSDFDRSDEGFTDLAFRPSSDTNLPANDFMYYGAYEAYVKSGSAELLDTSTILSLSGKSVYTGYTFSEACEHISYRYGNDVTIENYVKRCYVLGLAMLVTKTRDLQNAIGVGYNNVNYREMEETGTLDAKGLFYGTASTINCIKCFGIENLWGNGRSYCGGIKSVSSTTLGVASGFDFTNNNIYTQVAVSNDMDLTEGGYIFSMIPGLDGAIITPYGVQADQNYGWTDMLKLRTDAGYAVVGGGSTIRTDTNDSTQHEFPSVAGGPFMLDTVAYPSPEDSTEIQSKKVFCSRIVM